MHAILQIPGAVTTGAQQVLLEDKNAVIYGCAGSIAGAVARRAAARHMIRQGSGVLLFFGQEAIAEGIEKLTVLGRAATLEDVGNVASEPARTMTAAAVNSSCGAMVD